MQPLVIGRLFNRLAQTLVEALEGLRQYVIREQLQLSRPSEVMGGMFHYNLEAFAFLFSIAILIGIISIPFSKERVPPDVFVLKMLQTLLFVALIGVFVELTITLHNDIVSFLLHDNGAGLERLTVDLSLKISSLAAVAALLLLAFVFTIPVILVLIALVFFLFMREFLLWTIYFSAPIIAPMWFLDFGPAKMVSTVPRMLTRAAGYMVVISVISVVLMQVSMASYGAYSDSIEEGDIPDHEELLDEQHPETYEGEAASAIRRLEQGIIGNASVIDIDLNVSDGGEGVGGVFQGGFGDFLSGNHSEYTANNISEIAEEYPEFDDPTQYTDLEEVDDDLGSDNIAAGRLVCTQAAFREVAGGYGWGSSGTDSMGDEVERWGSPADQPYSSDILDEGKVYFRGYQTKENKTFTIDSYGGEEEVSHKTYLRIVYHNGGLSNEEVVEHWMESDSEFTSMYATCVSAIGQTYGTEAGLIADSNPTREIPFRAAVYECVDIRDDLGLEAGEYPTTENLMESDKVDYTDLEDTDQSFTSPGGETFSMVKQPLGLSYDPDVLLENEEFTSCVADVEEKYGSAYAGNTYVWNQPYHLAIAIGNPHEDDGGSFITDLPVISQAAEAADVIGDVASGVVAWTTDPGGQIRGALKEEPEVPDVLTLQERHGGAGEANLGSGIHNQISSKIWYDNDVQYRNMGTGDLRECSIAGDGVVCAEGVNQIETLETFMFWLIGFLFPVILYYMGLRAALSQTGAGMRIPLGKRIGRSRSKATPSGGGDSNSLTAQAKSGLQNQDRIDVSKPKQVADNKLPWRGDDTTGAWNSVGTSLSYGKGGVKRLGSGAKHMTLGGGWKQSPAGWAKSGLSHFRQNPLLATNEDGDGEDPSIEEDDVVESVDPQSDPDSDRPLTVSSGEELEEVEDGQNLHFEDAAYEPELTRFSSDDGNDIRDVRTGSEEHQQLADDDSWQFEQERGYINLSDSGEKIPAVAFSDAQETVQNARGEPSEAGKTPIKASKLRKRVHDKSDYEDGDGWAHSAIGSQQYTQAEFAEDSVVEESPLATVSSTTKSGEASSTSRMDTREGRDESAITISSTDDLRQFGEVEEGEEVQFEGALYESERIRFSSDEGEATRDVEPGTEEHQQLVEDDGWRFEQERGYLNLKGGDEQVRVPTVVQAGAHEELRNIRENPTRAEQFTPVNADKVTKRTREIPTQEDESGWSHDKVGSQQYTEVEITKNSVLDPFDELI